MQQNCADSISSTPLGSAPPVDDEKDRCQVDASNDSGRYARSPGPLCTDSPLDDEEVVDEFETTGERVVFVGHNDPRQGGQNLKLAHPLMSKSHAIIHKENGTFFVLDYELCCGTLINSRLIYGRVELANGDLLGFGLHNSENFVDGFRLLNRRERGAPVYVENAGLAFQFLVKITEKGLVLKRMPECCNTGSFYTDFLTK